jgi:hypothetical protein
VLSGGPNGRLDLYALYVPFSSNVVNDRCIEMRPSRVHAFTLHQVAASPPSGDSGHHNPWQMHRDGIISAAWEVPCIRSRLRRHQVFPHPRSMAHA